MNQNTLNSVQNTSEEQLKVVQLEFLFQNVNLETSLYYNIMFQEGSLGSGSTDGGVFKTVERLPFLPRLFDSTASYFNDSIPLWIMKVIFLLFLLYNGVEILFVVDILMTAETAQEHNQDSSRRRQLQPGGVYRLFLCCAQLRLHVLLSVDSRDQPQVHHERSTAGRSRVRRVHRAFLEIQDHVPCLWFHMRTHDVQVSTLA